MNMSVFLGTRKFSNELIEIQITNFAIIIKTMTKLVLRIGHETLHEVKQPIAQMH